MATPPAGLVKAERDQFGRRRCRSRACPHPDACVYRKLDCAILVMESAEDRLWCDGAEALNGPSKRRREIIVPTFEAPEGLAIFVPRSSPSLSPIAHGRRWLDELLRALRAL